MTNSNTDKTYLHAVAAILRDAAPHNVNDSPLLMQMLIYIACNPGCCSKTLEYEFEVDQATISRTAINLRKASYWGRRPSRRMGLIRLCQRSGKRHRFEITEAGERYLAKLTGHVSDASCSILKAYL